MTNSKFIQTRSYDLILGILNRLFEIVVSATFLILSMPFMVIIGIIIRLDSPGSALFWQMRIGLNGKPFKFVKFRTLYADARQRFPELYTYQYSEQEIQTLIFKSQDDPRVTRIGRWLRRSTLDEIPNFWNVLVGDMAFVGPRPEIPEMMRYYHTPEMRLKFSVRPGITGLSQVSGRAHLTFLETVELDLEYVKNRTWAMDISIIIRTIKTVLFRTGAY